MDFTYLDNSATTNPCEAAITRINTALVDDWGNPSSLYEFGLNAELILDDTRNAITKLLSCKQNEIYFTSGGTESNNIAIIGTAISKRKLGNKIVTTKIEHSSVLEPMKYLEAQGFEVVYLSPDENGFISEDAFASAIDEKTILVSAMLVNNETGCILPIEKIKPIIRRAKSPALLHCDCVQAFGKMPINVSKLGVDLLSASGHKIHGPKGVGFLYKNANVHISPLTFGGHQEKNLRPGTESVPLISGLCGAIEEINVSKKYETVRALFEYAHEKLSQFENVIPNSPKDNVLPYIVNFSVLGIRSETLLHFLESKGICVSSGSACAKGKGSYVLQAMGLDNSRVDSAIRISFSYENTKEDIDRLCDAINEANKTLTRRK